MPMPNLSVLNCEFARMVGVVVGVVVAALLCVANEQQIFDIPRNVTLILFIIVEGL